MPRTTCTEQEIASFDQLRGIIAEQLHPKDLAFLEELAEAQRLAREWKAKGE